MPTYRVIRTLEHVLEADSPERALKLVRKINAEYTLTHRTVHEDVGVGAHLWAPLHEYEIRT